MYRYFLRRLLYLVPIVVGITFLTFLLTYILPGDPALSLVGERAGPEVIEKIRRDMGVDRPFLVQYLGYLKMMSQGRMGMSYFTRRDVFSDILQKFPNTLKLALAAMTIALPVGIILGFISAERRGRIMDRVVSSVSVVGLSIPVFWSGLIIMFVFALELRLVPPSGTGGIRFMVLPAITLALPAMATIARITRASAIEVYEMPFITAARSKGLRERTLRMVHVFRNVVIPVVTVAGLDFGSYLNGSVLTETIFGWDGIGRYTMEGIIRRDYPVVMGGIVAGTVVFVLINLLVDIAYHFLDPRVRLHEVRR